MVKLLIFTPLKRQRKSCTSTLSSVHKNIGIMFNQLQEYLKVTSQAAPNLLNAADLQNFIKHFNTYNVLVNTPDGRLTMVKAIYDEVISIILNAEVAAVVELN